MNDELISKVLESQESLAAFFTLYEQYDSIRPELWRRLDAQLDEIARTIGLERQGSLCDPIKGDFYFRNRGLDRVNLKIGFGFDSSYHDRFYYGFKIDREGEVSPVEHEIRDSFKKQFSFCEERNSSWPASAYWEEYQFWTHEVLIAICSGQFAEDFGAKLKSLAKIARQVCAD